MEQMQIAMKRDCPLDVSCQLCVAFCCNDLCLILLFPAP